MKKLIYFLFAFGFLNSCTDLSYGQDYIHLNKNKSSKEIKFKSSIPTVSVTVVPVTFSQINFITGFDQVTYSGGVWSANATSWSFTPSYTLGSAQATITVTAQGDTIYHLSKTLAYGAGLTIYNNVATGKAAIAPSLIGQVGEYWAAVIGYDITNKQLIAGVSVSLASSIPFLNNLTHIRL